MSANLFHSGPAAHGDYVFGWQGNTLQAAMDNNCNLNADCPKAGIHKQTDAEYNACTKAQMAPETVDGCKSQPRPSSTTQNTANVDGFRDQGTSTRRQGRQGIRALLFLALLLQISLPINL